MLLFLVQCSFSILGYHDGDRAREGKRAKKFYFVSKMLPGLSGSLQVIIPAALTHQVPSVLVAGEGVYMIKPCEMK